MLTKKRNNYIKSAVGLTIAYACLPVMSDSSNPFLIQFGSGVLALVSTLIASGYLLNVLNDNSVTED